MRKKNMRCLIKRYGISELETINTNILIHKKECVSDPTLLIIFFDAFCMQILLFRLAPKRRKLVIVFTAIYRRLMSRKVTTFHTKNSLADLRADEIRLLSW